MSWFNNIKVGAKVFIASFVFIVLIVLISVVSIISLQNSDKAFNNFYENRFVRVVYMDAIARDILQIRINMLQVQRAAINGDNEEIKNRNENTAELVKHYSEYWIKYQEGREASARGKELTASYEGALAKMVSSRQQFNKAIEEHNIEVVQTSIDEWAIHYGELRDTINSLIELEEQAGLSLREEVNKETVFTRILTLVLFACSLLVAGIVTVILSRAISKPVQKGLAFATELAEGNFVKRIDLNQKDELGMLGNSLNSAAEDLEQTIAEVVIGTQNLSQAIQEISSGNENLSQRTSEQASSLEEIASTIEESGATINQNADNSNEANKLSQQTSEIAREGGLIMQDAVLAINEINESSNKIAEIISVINEISFQTNLLALNAAVEAARAGEQGRGFAVVAGEVRNLAQRSGNAAKEITNLINDSLSKVQKGTDLANKSGESLKEIIAAVENVTKLVSEIAASSDEQKQGTSQINVAVAELDTMTQQNASLVEEIASASEEMANQSQGLLSMVEKFKIGDRFLGGSQSRSQIHLKSKSQKTTQAPQPRPSDEKNQSVQKAEPLPTPTAVKNNSSGREIEDILTQEGFEEF